MCWNTHPYTSSLPRIFGAPWGFTHWSWLNYHLGGDCLETRVHNTRDSLTPNRLSYKLLHPPFIHSGSHTLPFPLCLPHVLVLPFVSNSKCLYASSLVDIFSLGELIPSVTRCSLFLLTGLLLFLTHTRYIHTLGPLHWLFSLPGKLLFQPSVQLPPHFCRSVLRYLLLSEDSRPSYYTLETATVILSEVPFFHVFFSFKYLLSYNIFSIFLA